MYTLVGKGLRIEPINNNKKMRITAHVSDELAKRLDKYLERKYKKRHGTLSMVVEQALERFLDQEEIENA